MRVDSELICKALFNCALLAEQELRPTFYPTKATSKLKVLVLAFGLL